MDEKSRFRGCLLGGAVGDALGAAVEFMSLNEIRHQFGPTGISDYAHSYGRMGAITDDTQMTLFTAEGLIRALVTQQPSRGSTSYSEATGRAYQRWLLTQGESNYNALDPLTEKPGWLYGIEDLHARRAPGNTCLSALRDMQRYDQAAANDSKGCGGVMRIAPVGLVAQDLQWSFDTACELAGLTHGHATGQLASGAFAAMVTSIKTGASIREAVDNALRILTRTRAHEETTAALELAIDLHDKNSSSDTAIQQMGEGWIAEEALAISVYCALTAPNFKEAMIMAVNHSGDSDSTGAITGNLLGCLSGESCIPPNWLDSLELQSVIAEVANDLYSCRGWPVEDHVSNQAGSDGVWAKYPVG